MRAKLIVGCLLAIGGGVFGSAPAQAGAEPVQLVQATDVPSYKPPLRGAPGGRVGGASRGGSAGANMPTIEPLAPDAHAGLTASATPILYYFVSQPVALPVKFTISAPRQAAPVVETNLTPPRQAGIYPIRLADYRVQLQPGIAYTWSVSVVVDPRAPSNDVVASATIMRVAPDPAVDSAARNAPPPRRAALFAQAGLWYDAVAAAVDGQNTDRHAALDALLDQVGLTEVANYDRRAVPAGVR